MSEKASWQVTLDELTAFRRVCDRHKVSGNELAVVLVRYLVEEMPLEERRFIVRTGGAPPSAPVAKRQSTSLEEPLHTEFRFGAGLTHGNVHKAMRGLYLWATTLTEEEIRCLLERKPQLAPGRTAQLRAETFLVI